MGRGIDEKEEKMNCMQCSGEMEKSTVTYTVDRKGYHLFLEEVPAYVCSQCGERFFGEDEVSSIQNMLRQMEFELEGLRKVA
jgi:YgiT-type zinc finger domain-containing protein